MGTRSTITFIGKVDDKEIPYALIYQQYDGYLSGVGAQLVHWLDKKVIVNGISDYRPEIANGLGCLVAQYIRDHKDEAGGLYVKPLTTDLDDIDYNYEVIFDLKASMSPRPGQKATEFVTFRVNNWGEDPYFEGSPEELLVLAKKEDEDE